MKKQLKAIKDFESETKVLLSKKEKQIIILMSEGKSNPKIGEILKISQNTVKVYLSKIFEKLNVTNRTQAAVKAVRDNII